MGIDLKMLRERPPRELGNIPPWTPLATATAARFLQVHPKTLLGWYRAGIGPEPTSKHEIAKQHFFLCRYLRPGSHLYFVAGILVAWWEHLCLGVDARSYAEICRQWTETDSGRLTLQMHPKLGLERWGLV